MSACGEKLSGEDLMKDRVNEWNCQVNMQLYGKAVAFVGIRGQENNQTKKIVKLNEK